MKSTGLLSILVVLFIVSFMSGRPAETQKEIVRSMATTFNDAENRCADASYWDTKQIDSKIYVVRTVSMEMSTFDVSKTIQKLFRHEMRYIQDVIISQSVKNYFSHTYFTPNFHSLSELKRFNI